MINLIVTHAAAPHCVTYNLNTKTGKERFYLQQSGTPQRSEGARWVFKLDVLNTKSGRRDSNSRMVAWEATALPLGYARIKLGYYFTAIR